MKVAYYSPMPPERTGIAHYSAMLLPELSKRLDVEVISTGDPATRQPGNPIYQLGNNPHHEWIYLEALKTPGVIVLHDVVLHHLIVEMTLARGDADAYAAALRASHGAVGKAWARGRAAGLHSEMGNFLLPASIEVANRSRAVIVHNRWAADLLRSFGVSTPIHVVPHPSRGPRPQPSPPHKVAGVFGFLTSAKRGEVILEAMSKTRGVELLVVGEAAPNIDASRFQTTGYVPDDEFDAYYARADRIVNLRYPTAGETSGTLIRAFEAGKPVAVSDYAQFAEYPDECVVKIPFGEGEAEALAEFLMRDFDCERIAKAQHEWLRANATVAQTADGYLQVLCGAADSAAEDAKGIAAGSAAPHRSVPLFPAFSATREADRVTLTNTGDFTIRTRVYGEPGYRLIAKLFEDEREIADRWIELPRDVAPGEQATVSVPYKAGATLRLYHAIEGIPMLDPEPWYAATL
ncbi:MAG TPA: glycosyltransferase [Thermoanaerobaculia bacterium]|jgi:glycosyltransferase involved in cell wall biosynthesis|nr:glycosyltransferase [Thermoanaerobaculia bacterium]